MAIGNPPRTTPNRALKTPWESRVIQYRYPKKNIEQSVVDDWHGMPEEFVEASTFESFKARLDKSINLLQIWAIKTDSLTPTINTIMMMLIMVLMKVEHRQSLSLEG